MSETIVIKYIESQYATPRRADLTRVGVIAGQNEDGSVVSVEPYAEGWNEHTDELCREVLQAGLMAAGVDAEVLTLAEYDATR